LLGRGIVVTRAREQASGLANLLAELGADVIQFPTIKISPLADYSGADAAVARLDGYDWLIFTSVNGVRHFWQRLAVRGKDSRALGGRKVAAIGPATADELRARGVEPDFIPEKYIAEGMTEGLPALGVAGKRVLLPRAKEAREVLPDELRKAGAVVDVLPVYETLPADARREEVLELLREGRIHCVTFGSSSTVHNFFSLIPADTLREYPQVKLAAIGPVTKKTLERYGLECRIMPEEYTIPALVESLRKEL
jgi:uroporphyrinogen III methyltransferase/synthase